MSFSVKCEDNGTTYTLKYCDCGCYNPPQHVHSVKLFQEISTHIPNLAHIDIFIEQTTLRFNNHPNLLLMPQHSGASIKIYTAFTSVKSANKR